MAKAKTSDKTVWLCGECGFESSKWNGQCPSCGSWNTLQEYKAPAVSDRRALTSGPSNSAVSIRTVESGGASRCSTGIGELDRVLGGGIVKGSTVLLGGDPGIGKSTLLMQAAANLAKNSTVLYVTGEESISQLKLRAERLDALGDMLVMAETDTALIEAEFLRVKPSYLIIDSIQTMYAGEISSAPGSVTQIRETTSLLTRLAKTGDGCAVFIVGHVTKEGSLAGPRVLEHMVDTVLYFEGDRHDAFRLLRAVKNRFGSTNEIGVFEMRESGMAEIDDPSALFISGVDQPGCAVTCALEGTRPMLVEVQALLSATAFSNPRRMSAGIDSGRLILLLAVLEKKAGLKLYDKDVYLNVVGGIRLDERACDLAAAICVASAVLESAPPKGTAFIGEIALTGEVRTVSRLEKRVQECARLGYSRIVLPATDASAAINIPGTELVRVKWIAEAVKLLSAK